MPRDIYKEVERLRKKHGKDRSLARSMPNYKIEQNVAPLSNRFATPGSTFRKSNPAPSHLIVSHLHKQGYQVLSKDDVQYASKKV